MDYRHLSFSIRFFSLLAYLSCSVVVFSQERDTTVENTSDTLQAASKAVEPPIIPIPLVGTLDRNLDSSKAVADTDAIFNDYNYLNDIIAAKTGTFVRDLGSVGQYSALTLGGLDSRSIAFLHDDILLNEPLTGTYNSYWYQTEQIDRVEIETGTRAFLYGLNSTGGAINMVSKRYKAIRPHTRIRYSESRYEQTFFDGQFSQNLTRNVNVTGGVQRVVTDGRSPNSDYDAWGARLKARWDLNNRWNFFFSENYTQTQLGLFGGVNYNATATTTGLFFDPLQAQIVTSDVYEKITRHDLQLGGAAALFDDSTDVTTLTAYYSTHLRELRDENNRPNADTFYIFDNHHVHWQGVKLTQHLSFDQHTLDLGAEVQSRQVIESPATRYQAQAAINAYGKIELQPIEHLRIAAYARLDRYMNRAPLSYGTDAALRIVDFLSLYAGYSRSYRFPTFQELYWRRRNISGPMQEFENERHDLTEIGLNLQLASVFHFTIRAFNRTVKNFITILPEGQHEPFPGVRFFAGERQSFRGIDASATLRILHFVMEGSAHYLPVKEELFIGEIDGESKTTRQIFIPDWWAAGGIYFRDKLFENNLDLKIGIRGRIGGEQQGAQFNPEAMMFVPSSLPSLGIATVADFALIAHIGRAYVHFIWQNLFDNNYVLTPFYPMPDRALRFGISWELLD